MATLSNPREQAETQSAPIKVYRSDDRLTIAAPMPGLEAEDISVEVTEEGRVILHGRLRGILKGANSILADEWNPGPYHREYELSESVDATAANVTYGNGVVVVALPRSARMQSAHLTLTPLPHDRGVRVGHAGKFTTIELAEPIESVDTLTDITPPQGEIASATAGEEVIDDEDEWA
jgi:HSP20 family protein